MRYFYLLYLVFLTIPVSAQNNSDSTIVLKFDELYSMVLQHHPIVQQAELLGKKALQEIRLARGAFDPKLQGSWDFKDFKDTEYYNLLDVSLKIPVWFPIDPKLGLAQNRGIYLNPENFIDDNTSNRQVYAGISIPVGQGLFIDQRRATVRKALLFQEMAEAEQVKEINKILLTVAKDYWNWYNAHNNYILMQQGITIAEEIFERTKMGFEYGELAAIDTVQAKITLLTRTTAFQEANIERVRASLTLSNHLWNAEGAPLQLEDNMKPEELITSSISTALLPQLLDKAMTNHPELRKLDLKNQSLTIDQSLAKENLKPRLDLNYYLLDQPVTPQGEQSGLNLGDNYKVGVDFSFPIFLRKERSKLNQVKIKLEENNFKRGFAEQQIINEIKSQFNTVVNMGTILDQQQQMADSYQLILNAEQLNLENGESDLFKINIQIEKLINAQGKLLKMKSTYQKNIATLYWAAGINQLDL